MVSSCLRCLGVFLIFLASSRAFLPSVPSSKGLVTVRTASALSAPRAPQQLMVVQQEGRASRSVALMKREVIPQLLFAAACAGAVIGYVATHIDEIREKQKVAVERTMKEQSKNIRSAQDAQREAIDAAIRKQDEAVRKISEDAKRRADEAARRR